jgi:small-conductance mechanosensitive channel
MLFLVSPADAVLKERNLKSTLAVLRTELENTKMELMRHESERSQRNKEMRQHTMETLENSDQTALMLYSQKMDYVFDLAYACNQATLQYNEYQKKRMPFDKIISQLLQDTTNYHGLIESLRHMPIMLLDKDAATDRDVCLTLANSIQKEKCDELVSLNEDRSNYEMVSERLKSLNDYANKRYTMIRLNIFKNGGDNYFAVLANLSQYYSNSKQAINSKYATNFKVHSDWSGLMVLGLFMFVLFYGLLSVFLNVLCIRFLMPKRLRTEDFLAKRTCIILASTVITFAVVIGVIRSFISNHDFFLMASDLLMQYSWLAGVILISLLVRLSSKQIKSGFRIYSPILVMGFIVIAFRIVLIPNEFVNLIFPPILLVFAIWQGNVIHRHGNKIPRSDVFYTWISLAMLITSVCVSWVGYTLLSVQLLIWWIMLLTCIQTITCVKDLLTVYEHKHIPEDSSIRRTWFLDFINKAVVPISCTFSVIISFYWAAQVFDLTEWCHYFFFNDFVAVPGTIYFSVIRLCFVVSLWFFFNYLMYLFRSFLILHFSNVKKTNGAGAIVIGKNLSYFLIWGLYLIITMKILQMGNSWILVITGGLSTGVGFALKDTLENLFYGLSLMAGRVHIGDFIECDGVRGKVSNINYQSTMVETLDGCEMAFLNSQLFSKNFKNLTRNHEYVLAQISVGVAYGSNIEDVRNYIVEAVSKLKCYNKEKGLNVMFGNFGDNSVDLNLVVWLPVKKELVAKSMIKEAIYNVLNEHHIEIPFPQRDIYVHKMDNSDNTGNIESSN